MNRKGGAMFLLVVFLIVLLVGLLVYYVLTNYEIVAVFPQGNNTTATTMADFNMTYDNISLVSFNLQIFGDSKEQDQAFLNGIKTAFSGYDIISLQEIRDSDGTAVKVLQDLFPSHTCVPSERLGRSTSKEQYLTCYSNKFMTYTTGQIGNYTEFERPPYYIKLLKRGSNETLIIVNAHLKPEDVDSEIRYLYNAEYVGPAVIMGDLNADCSYWSRDDNSDVFQDWYWAIPDYADTTSGSTNCAYDRLIMNFPFKDGGVLSDLGLDSDHYPVFAII